MPSAYGDADAKVTSPLELQEVLRRLANLGTGYPEVVAILENGRPARRTCLANWLSTRYPAPTPSTWKRSWVKTSPASATTP